MQEGKEKEGRVVTFFLEVKRRIMKKGGLTLFFF